MRSYSLPCALWVVITYDRYNTFCGFLGWIYFCCGNADSIVAIGAYAFQGETDQGAGTVAVGYGGTGLASFTTGNIMYASGSATISKLAPVADGILIMNAGGTAPTWSTAIAGGTF